MIRTFSTEVVITTLQKDPAGDPSAVGDGGFGVTFSHHGLSSLAETSRGTGVMQRKGTQGTRSLHVKRQDKVTRSAWL